MDNRCIGVFDSGLGGLTAVKEISRLMPGENIIYFGDTGRVPYGTRSKETILRYVAQDIAFLMRYDPKVIIAACGTASAVALPLLAGNCDVPVMGVVEAAASAAATATRNKKIGIMGTAGTIKSGAYERILTAIDPAIETVAVACPLFVPLVENGYIQKDDEIARLAAKEYLGEIMAQGADTIILGCTHYPLLKPVLSDIIGADTVLIDPGYEVAGRLFSHLTEHSLQNGDKEHTGEHQYFVSDSSENFAAIGEVFLGTPIRSEVCQIEIEKISGWGTHG